LINLLSKCLKHVAIEEDNVLHGMRMPEPAQAVFLRAPISAISHRAAAARSVLAGPSQVQATTPTTLCTLVLGNDAAQYWRLLKASTTGPQKFGVIGRGGKHALVNRSFVPVDHTRAAIISFKVLLHDLLIVLAATIHYRI
jgi:hypothetical protein